MADTDTAASEQQTASWMSDVQRALAIGLIATFCIIVCGAALRLVWTGSVDAIEDLTKTLTAALVNMCLIGLGFFFGNTVAKLTADRGQQRIVDKLTSAPPGSLPPPPTGATPWWPKLTEDEKTAISKAAVTDPRVAAFVTSANVGTASPDDLAYLVSKNLLMQSRADTIRT